MISRIALENWRGYASLDLDLPNGTLFLVSRNGVGKTSLVTGLAWALFGEHHAPVDLARSIRAGADYASASIEFTTSSSQLVRIRRRVTRAPLRTETESWVDGALVTGEVLEELLRSEFAADVAFVASTSILGEGAIMRMAAEPGVDIYNHLCELFGVAGLTRDQTSIRRFVTAIEDEGRQTRRATGLMAGQRRKLEEQLNKLEIEEAELRQKSQQALLEVETAARQEALRDQWISHRQLMARYSAEEEQVLAEARELLDAPSTNITALRSWIVEEENDISAALEGAQLRLGATQSHIQLIDSLKSQLGDAHRECPVCLRPLAPEEVEAAEARHLSALATAHSETSVIEAQINALRARRNNLLRIQARLGDLYPPTPPDRPEPEGSGSEDLSLRARQLHQQLNEELVRISGEKQNLAFQLSEDRRDQQIQKRLISSYRRQALANALGTAATDLAARITSLRVDPLARELEQRWKSVWDYRPPLSFEPGGGLKMHHGEGSISFQEFSGGERVIAVLLLRILTMLMTTQARFLMLDEPLEHLDPRNRRLVASMLVRATAEGQFNQILTTTYEEAVARRLAEQVGNAHIIHVAADQGAVRA